MKRIIHYSLSTLAILAFGCLAPPSIHAQDRSRSFFRGAEGAFDRTLNVSGVVSIEISTGSGSIDIRSGGGNRVEIHGKIRSADSWFRSSRDSEDVVRRFEANPPIEQVGQTIRIGRIDDREADRNVSISYELVVPNQSNVRSHTGSGSQTVDGITGRVEVGTGSGSITLRTINGDLDANTGSGSIYLAGFRGGLRMQTGSGSIRVQGEQTGRWELQTGSGGIDIDLPPNASFELNAHTGSGGVDVRYPMTVQGTIDTNRRNVTGRVGNGGNALNARTGSGHIRID